MPVTKPSEPSLSLTFSTSMLPPAKRLSAWRDIVGGSPMNLSFGEIERGTFSCDFASLRLPDVMLVTLEGSPFTVSRDRVAATRSDDGINIALAKRGHLLSSSGVREVKNRPGEAMVWANDQPVETVFPAGGTDVVDSRGLDGAETALVLRADHAR